MPQDPQQDRRKDSNRSLQDLHDYLEQALAEGKQRMDRMEVEMQENTVMTTDLKKDTSEVLEILAAVKGGLKVLGGLGQIIKWAGMVAAGVAAILALVKGHWPAKW
jgi:hypothetical protein